MSENSKTHVYRTNEKALSLDEVENFIKEECQPWVWDALCIMIRRAIVKEKTLGAKAFGFTQARELVLQLFVKTGGDILLS